MKVVIDIPEDMYNDANIFIVKDLPELKKIIANGIPYEERPQGKWEFCYTADNNLDEIIRCSVCHRFDTAKYIDGRNPYCDYPRLL